MVGGIFLQRGESHLIEMTEETYDSEDLLQGLLAQYPSLLDGNQINPKAPRRWILIAREMGVPDKENVGDRWSLDHLFLDQDAIPTLVEVKRASDTRLRREVVGQLLDYAANGVSYWSLDNIKSIYIKQCEVKAEDPDTALRMALELDEGVEEFWLRVETNLQLGKLRLVFVADSIPSELQRIIEFLNDQMHRTEVLGVEIRKYAGGTDFKTLVPRVVGVSANTRLRKVEGYWDESSFLTALKEHKNYTELEEDMKAGIKAAVDEILQWSEENEVDLFWGKGGQIGSFSPRVILAGGIKQILLTISTTCYINVRFDALSREEPFRDELLRKKLGNRLSKIPGFTDIEGKIGRQPGYKLKFLANPDSRRTFLEAFSWVVDTIRSGSETT